MLLDYKFIGKVSGFIYIVCLILGKDGNYKRGVLG